MNTQESVIAAIGNTAVALLAGAWLQRRKYAAAAESNELENVEKAIAIWRNLAGELERKVEMLNTQVSNLLEQNKQLKLQIGHLEKELQKRK